MDARARLVVALNNPDLADTATLARAVLPHCGMVKLGWQFFAANGPSGVRMLGEMLAPMVADRRMPLMLDLKLHDTPDTVAPSLAALMPLAPCLVTIHARGGRRMLAAARRVLGDAPPWPSGARPGLLAVVRLTSLSPEDLDQALPEVGIELCRNARLAMHSGCDGLICRGDAIRQLRALVGPQPLFAVPGCRLADDTAVHDHTSVITPGMAIRAGADLVVMGRPFRDAADPAALAHRVVAEIAEALAER